MGLVGLLLGAVFGSFWAIARRDVPR